MAVVDPSVSAPTQTTPTKGWRDCLVRAGLQGKLIIGFLILLFLALGTSFWVYDARSKSTLADIMGEQATQLSMSLALASKSPMAIDDRLELDRMARDLLKSRNIVLISFYDPAGKPLAIACRDPQFETVEMLADLPVQKSTQQLMQVQHVHSPVLDDFLEVVAPVVGTTDNDHRQHLLGFVTVGISQAREQAQLRQVSYLGLTLGSLIFILSLPLAAALVHRILLPIRQLVAATRQIAAGDYNAKVAVHRPDEIGTLARSFNEMILQVKAHQASLEDKVAQRTTELANSNKRLSLEMAEKEDFLRAVSHDLNAPLRNIDGMVTMLLTKHREKLDEDIVHRLDRISRNVRAETDLIEELLELSRIKTRRQRVERVDVDAMVKDFAGIFDNDLRSRSISLIIDPGRRLPFLMGDKARIRRVFQNLIDNAVKYMGDGPIREIHIGGKMTPAGAEFYVRDTGIGIEADDLPKVFFIFRRGKNSAAQNVAGKGVGLASVKSIIETFGGRITVQSEVGRGSLFTFNIDRQFVAPQEFLEAAA